MSPVFFVRVRIGGREGDLNFSTMFEMCSVLRRNINLGELGEGVCLDNRN